MSKAKLSFSIFWSLRPKWCVLAGEVVENYKFVVQDEVQGFHWNNLQCTVHPVVIYFIYDSVINHHSYCAISDDITYDVAFVYEMQKKVLDDIKQRIPGVKQFECFSDDCGGNTRTERILSTFAFTRRILT